MTLEERVTRLIRPLHVAGANFGIEGKERIWPEFISGFNALLCETVVGPLRSWWIVILNARCFILTGCLHPS